MSDASTPRKAEVELRLPADGAYASVLRTTTAGLAARLDFTLDDIEDLRIAIGEATALVIAEADPGTDVVCGFHFSPGHLTLDLAATAIDNPEVDRESFAWQVLETMADDVSATSESGIFRVSFSVTSQLAAMAPAPGTGADA